MKWGSWIGVLALGGIAGLAVAGVTTEVVQRTGTNEFCIACHEMTWPQETYQQEAHFANPSGVRVPCIACHVDEHPWYDLLWGKAAAGTRDVWGHLTGKLATREDYEAKREEMSQKVIDYLTRTDSETCRNCHAVEAMTLEEQNQGAKMAHEQAVNAGITCITCHQGVGHAPAAEAAKAEEDKSARLADQPADMRALQR
ncbi:NapC/NirT family cytochrome c [Afifella pfennigii]|uniref:NapC/NirT family cytochrome c n=1 Tax=Afifella pfennigii TaxID=209897 RepID=UPI00068BF7A4|nr:NapC/NirT family cytochrome c [Afifella pfennigii]